MQIHLHQKRSIGTIRGTQPHPSTPGDPSMFQYVTHRTRCPFSVTGHNPATREHNDVGEFLRHRSVKGTDHQTTAFSISPAIRDRNRDQGGSLAGSRTRRIEPKVPTLEASLAETPWAKDSRCWR